MIAKFVIGSGNARREIPMQRDRRERRSAAGALKGHLFPTKQAHEAALQRGQQNNMLRAAGFHDRDLMKGAGA